MVSKENYSFGKEKAMSVFESAFCFLPFQARLPYFHSPFIF
jgi:hypothetical protein